MARQRRLAKMILHCSQLVLHRLRVGPLARKAGEEHSIRLKDMGLSTLLPSWPKRLSCRGKIGGDVTAACCTT